MSLQFEFIGFDPEETLRENAHRSLDRLLDLSPYGAVPVALLEKTTDGYRCAIDIYTRQGPLVAQSYRGSPAEALTHVCEVLFDKLTRRGEGGTHSRELKHPQVSRGAHA